MSYDTTLNDAIDPPASCLPARERSGSRWWKFGVFAAVGVLLASIALGVWLLR